MKNRERCPPALHLESVFASGIILPRTVQVPHLSEVYQEETSKSILGLVRMKYKVHLCIDVEGHSNVPLCSCLKGKSGTTQRKGAS